jgi:hypothetical protein
VPSGWPKNVKSAVLHVVSLAHYAITCARGWAANSINARVQLSSDNDRLNQDNQLFREELRIKDARIAKLEPRRRPHYPATERMAILALKAVRGKPGVNLQLVVDFHQGRKHLPVVTLRQVA